MHFGCVQPRRIGVGVPPAARLGVPVDGLGQGDPRREKLSGRHRLVQARVGAARRCGSRCCDVHDVSKEKEGPEAQLQDRTGCPVAALPLPRRRAAFADERQLVMAKASDQILQPSAMLDKKAVLARSTQVNRHAE